MIGFKGFESDLTCRGFRYKIGETYELKEDENLEVCTSGFHFCTDLKSVYEYYPFGGSSTSRVCVVKTLGKVQRFGTKCCTDKIKILEEVPYLALDSYAKLMCEIESNSKHVNSNEGVGNTGTHNFGNWNTGRQNNGDSNTGDDNTGDCNTGDSNTGDYNSGYYNIGELNSGDSNKGNRNSGFYNIGDNNTGYCNVGNFLSGAFNDTYTEIMLFNKPYKVETPGEIELVMESCYRVCRWIKHKGEFGPSMISKLTELPNFDPEVFNRIRAAHGYDPIDFSKYATKKETETYRL